MKDRKSESNNLCNKKAYSKAQRAIIVSIVIIFFLLLAFSYVAILIYFQLGNELSIRLEPSHISLNLTHGEKQDVAVTLLTNNNPLCGTYCEYMISDPRNDSILESGSYKLEAGSNLTVQYTLASPVEGRGQIVYNIFFNCHYGRNIICQSDGKNVTQSSLLTLKEYPLVFLNPYPLYPPMIRLYWRI